MSFLRASQTRKLRRMSGRAGPSWALGAVAMALALGATAPAAAQGVVGHLYDFDTGVIVATAEVVMTNQAGDTVGRAISDRDGRFVILVEYPGDYLLSVSRIGYVSEVSTNIRLVDRELQDVEMTVHADAVAIQGLVVSTAPRVRALNALGFYDRKERGRGNYVLPTETEKAQAFSTSGLLRSVPGITVRDGVVHTMRREIQGANLRQGPCVLKVLVNGIDAGVNLDNAIRRYDVSAIEVYKSIGSVPPEYLGSASSGYLPERPPLGQPQPGELESSSDMQRTCGAVLVWTVFGG